MLAVTAVAVALYAVVRPLSACRYPPMTDLPFHAAQTSTFRHYLDPSFHLEEQFELHPLGVPYMSMYAIGAVLMLVLPALTATKIAAGVMLALLPAGLAVMFHGMKKSPLLGLLGLGALWVNLTQWGFLNFVGALGLFAMVIGLSLMLVDKPTKGRAVALAVTLVVLFFTHIFRFPFAMAAVAGTAIVMYPATKRLRPIVAPLLPAVALFGLWLWARPKALESGSLPLELHKERLGEVKGLLVGSFADPMEVPAFETFLRVMMAVAAASVAISIVSLLLGVKRKEPWTWDLGVTVIPLACAAVFLFLFLALPMQMGAWWYVYPREATAACFVALGAFPDLPKPAFLRAPFAAAIAWAGLSITAVVAKNYAQFDTVTNDFKVVADEVPRGSKLLYLIFDHSGSTRTNTPFIHLPAYIQADKGGWLSFHFAMWGASPVLYRDPKEPGAVIPPPVPLRWEWTPQAFNLQRQGAFFDWFLVRQRHSPDAIFAADKSIELVDHQGTFWLYRRKK